MRISIPVRWVVYGVFILSSAINFLDRQLLAALAPDLRIEFSLNNTQYGLLVSAFSIAYAASAPFAGWFIDRVGLNLGSTFAVAGWSLAGISTAFTRGLGGLLGCRTVLGVFEGGGIPGTGKAAAMYLDPGERAMGGAISQLGLTVGFILAPLVAGFMTVRYGWRSAFLVTGGLGLLWIPLWWFASKRAPLVPDTAVSHVSAGGVWKDRRYLGLLAANILSMCAYALWVNWTTVFLVDRYGMTQADANRQLAWIPPVFASLGGIFGGWLSIRWVARGRGLVSARMRAVLFSAVGLLATALVPLSPSPALATAGICFSFFACLVGSVNLYALPLDLFGAGRAALGVGGMTASYGLMQTIFSPLAGASIDRFGFEPVCIAVAILPLAAYGVLLVTVPRSSPA